MRNEDAKNEFLVNLYAPALAWIKAITDAEDGTIDEVREVMVEHQKNILMNIHMTMILSLMCITI